MKTFLLVLGEDQTKVAQEMLKTAYPGCTIITFGYERDFREELPGVVAQHQINLLITDFMILWCFFLEQVDSEVPPEVLAEQNRGGPAIARWRAGIRIGEFLNAALKGAGKPEAPVLYFSTMGIDDVMDDRITPEQIAHRTMSDKKQSKVSLKSAVEITLGQPQVAA